MVAARTLCPAPRAIGETRAGFWRLSRGFFASEGFVEVDTPALQVSPGLEPHLRAFATQLHDPRDGSTRRRYLHTSPEFAMKKLLAAGMPRIWQLAHVFRDGERGPTHHPEFAMLEWYRAGASWRDLIPDCRRPAARVPAQAAGGRGHGHGDGQRAPTPVGRGARSASPGRSSEYCGIDILATAAAPLNPDVALLAGEARRIGIEPHPGDDWETLYFRIFLDRIEPAARHRRANDPLRLPGLDGRIVAAQARRSAPRRAL